MSTTATPLSCFGERIDDLCVEHDISYAELARRVKIDRTTLYHMRTEKKRLPLALVTLVMIADQFGVSTDWLLGRTDYRRPR